MFFQLADMQTLQTKYEAHKLKHSKLLHVLEDYQITIGDLKIKLEDLKAKKTIQRPNEPSLKVHIFIFF